MVSLRILPHHIHCLSSVHGLFHLRSGHTEQLSGDFPVQLIVLDQQDLHIPEGRFIQDICDLSVCIRLLGNCIPVL